MHSVMRTIRMIIQTVLLFGLPIGTTFAQSNAKLDQFRKVLNYKGPEVIYVVIMARDVKGNEKKAVATTLSALGDAVATEEDLDDRDPKILKIIQANDSLVFPFEYKNALSDISFNLYSEADLKKYSKQVNIDSIKKSIAKNPAVNTKLRATMKDWQSKFNNKAKSFNFKKDRMMFADSGRFTLP